MANYEDTFAPINIDVGNYENFTPGGLWTITNPATPVIVPDNNGRRLNIDGLPRFPCYKAKRTGTYSAFTLTMDMKLYELQPSVNYPTNESGGILGLFLFSDTSTYDCIYSGYGTSNIVQAWFRRFTTAPTPPPTPPTSDVLEFWFRWVKDGVVQQNVWDDGYYAVWSGAAYATHPFITETNPIRFIFTKTQTTTDMTFNLQIWTTNGLGGTVTRLKNWTYNHIANTTNPIPPITHTYFVTGCNGGASGGPATYTATADLQDYTIE